VLSLAHVVNADMNFGAARHLAGEFFADEEIRMAAQLFRAFDGVVIGQGEEIHAASLQNGVDLLWIAITFAAKFSDKGGRAGSGEVGVNMQVAFHETKCNFALLRAHDTLAKVLKTLPLNS